jgi:TonB family protein
MKNISIILFVIAVAGCSSTSSQYNSAYDSLPVTDNLLASQQWSGLKRFAPMYPVDQAKKGQSGCATVEYVITPDYQITNIKIVDTDGKTFGKEAEKVIQRWHWEDLNKGMLTQAIKTQTRFEFCLPDDKDCSTSSLVPSTECRGGDVITVVGSIIRVE